MKFFVLTISSILLACLIITAQELCPLYPKSIKAASQIDKSNPGISWPMDPLYPIQHVGESAQFYVFPGAEDDTFFVVFNTPAPCSVHYAEIEWYNYGIVDGFAAHYSAEAEALYPDGHSPERGTSPVSPVGEWITGLIENEVHGVQQWEYFDLGDPFQIGDLSSFEGGKFGIGFVKRGETPNPLSVNQIQCGIDHTYTWFGGPWNIGGPWEYLWGGLRSSQSYYFPEELMARVWVEYYGYFGPIATYNLTQLPHTYNQQGPFRVTCTFDGMNEITEEDTLMLFRSVNWEDTVSVPLQELIPGSLQYYADITGPFSLGDEVRYWVHTINEMGQEFITPVNSFGICEPANPSADLLFVYRGVLSGQYLAMNTIIQQLGIEYEGWNAYNGIDESVVNYGWNNILASGQGLTVMSPDDDPNPFIDFLDNGGNLCLIDQDWFYANGLPQEGAFEPGDFAYDYFGLGGFVNDPENPDTVYIGVPGDPVTGEFHENLYETYWNGPAHFPPENIWADYLTAGNGDAIFSGAEDENCCGVKYDPGIFKTVFLSFTAEAANEFYGDSVAISVDFRTLIENICEWFEIPHTEIVPHPSPTVAEFTLFPNYPNPFNSETTISFSLPSQSKIEVSIYNIEGKLAEKLYSGQKAAGVHSIKWEAGDLASGIYVCRITLQSAGTLQHRNAVRKLLLLK